MPFTLVAFVESQLLSALGNIAALADPHVRAVGDYIYVPTELPWLAGYYFVGPFLAQARIASPSLRTLCNPDVEGMDVGAEPASPPNMHDKFASPKALAGDEGLEALALYTGGERAFATALAWLSSGPAAPVIGEIFTVYATGATTLTARVWTNVTLTFAQTLPSGRYQIVGMRARSAGCIAARLVIPGHPWRPGCLGCDSVSDLADGVFRHGKAGVWGEFDHDVPPTVDFLSISADTAEYVFLDLIKIA